MQNSDSISKLLNLHQFNSAISESSNDKYTLFKIRNKLGLNKQKGLINLVWKIDPNLPSTWEGEFIRSLFSGISYREVFDKENNVVLPNSIIIDNIISDNSYYEELFYSDIRFGIFHISDESYSFSINPYKFTDLILRNYPFFNDSYADILNIPLGFKSGFIGNINNSTVFDRKYIWSFAGDPNKSDRKLMKSSFGSVPGGYIFETNGFFDPNALSVSEYSNILNNTIFTLCPHGNVHLDSFRIYEALESGSIPVMIDRYSKYYFSKIFEGSIPFLFFDNWTSAASSCVDLLKNLIQLEEIRIKNENFWKSEKLILKNKICKRINDYFY